jgi:Ca2+-binding RTX toxin-like protein
MIGTDLWDKIESHDGRDHIWGMPTGDDLLGGADGDIIYGNPGNDVIRGQNGNDWVLCNVADCGLDGGNNDDDIHGWVGTDVLIGGPGNDEMFGGDQPDRLYARDGQRDFVYGGDADDFCQVDDYDFYQWC